MRKLTILAALILMFSVLIIPCVCFADAAGSYTLSSVYVTMTGEPTVGSKAPSEFSAGSRINVSNIVWKDSNGQTVPSTQSLSAGTYTLSFDLDRVTGDSFAGRTSVYINNSAEGVERKFVNSNKITVTKAYSISGRPTSSGRLSNATGKAQYLDEASYKPVSTIIATISWPKEGEVLDQNPKMDETEGAIVLGVVWSRRDSTGEFVEITDKEYKAVVGESYIASILFKFDVGYKLDPNTTSGRVNTNEPCEVTNTNGNCCITSLTMGIRSTAGSTASRPSTSTSTSTRPATSSTGTRPSTSTSTPTRPTTGSTATRPSASGTEATVDPAVIAEIVEALNSGEGITLISGDMPTFVRPGVVKPIETTLKSGDKITDLITTEVGEKSGDKEPAKTEEPEKKEEPAKTEEPAQKIVWTEASGWALDELTKANEAGLIPMVLDKTSLKANITRKEFAHVAVKLYEKLTGKKAEVSSKNPFTDTKDTEILKAYKLEITNGTTDTTFTPDAEITREQMAAMMQRALKAAGIDTKVDLTKVKEFSDDNEMHNWSREAIYFMSEAGIIKGVSTTENRYGVKGNATREQSVIISIRSAEKFAK